MAERKNERFVGNMTVKDAVYLHPDASMVLASFHLGGCAHCGINGLETLEQVCMGYGVPIESLLETLNGLLES